MDEIGMDEMDKYQAQMLHFTKVYFLRQKMKNLSNCIAVAAALLGQYKEGYRDGYWDRRCRK